MEKILLGTGPLAWEKTERVTDRYGTVFLHPLSSTDQPLDMASFDMRAVRDNIGRKGKLLAEVITARESTHIGDLFHGFYPSVPSFGEEIELGEGEFFYELQYEKFDAVGLRPADGRREFWLIPPNLYRAHEQTVKLYFNPID